MTIAIASGKGGTGKTFVSTNLFWIAREAGQAVDIIDCDAEEPNVTGFITGKDGLTKEIYQHVPVIDTDKCTLCGKCSDYCSYHAIIFIPQQRYIRVLEELCHDCGACSYACTSGAITEKTRSIGQAKYIETGNRSNATEAQANIGVYSPVQVIKEAIAGAVQHELVLLDAPPGISCPFIATVVPADFVVLVTEPTPFGLNDLKLSVETLRLINKPFGVVINRAGLGNKEVYRWLEAENIRLLIDIPFDKEIARLYAEGRLVVEELPQYKKLFISLLKQLTQNLSL